MSQAVFQAGIEVSRVHPSDWVRAGIVMLSVLAQCTGLIVLLSAIGLVYVRVRPGVGRRLVAPSGAVIVCILLLSAALQPGEPSRWESVLGVPILCVSAFLVIPVCAFLTPHAFVRGRFDMMLWALCAGELALLIGLARASTGVWVNYALEAGVLASILTARALARLCRDALHPGSSIFIALAALVVLVIALRSTYEADVLRRQEQRVVAEILRAPDTLPPSSSSPVFPVGIASTAGSIWCTTIGSIPSLSRFIWRSRDRSGFGLLSRPATSSSSSRILTDRTSTDLAKVFISSASSDSVRSDRTLSGRSYSAHRQTNEATSGKSRL